ncbi:MAG: hypothetical protein LQ345_003007 [Seirophora villosa]|nr:MAG: hypothetical protein LQ345_003007 [Seirophora villosa]
MFLLHHSWPRPIEHQFLNLDAVSRLCILHLAYLTRTPSEMSFYYNYTGPFPGSVNVNRESQPSSGKAENPASPWLAQRPEGESQASAGASVREKDYFVYYPRYDQNYVQPASNKAPEPANPWLASPPEAMKASAPSARIIHAMLATPLFYAGHPQPEPTRVWYGSTKAEVDAQNAALAQDVGAYKPMELIPANPTAGQQFYCRELDGTYTLRTMTDIETACQPGAWHRASTGYPYFIRNKAA